MNLQPLNIEKNYVINNYFNPNTGNSYDIKQVQQVFIKYKDGTEQVYDLFYKVDYERDMGCFHEIINCYIVEEFRDFPVHLYLTDILNKGHEIFVVDGDKYEIKPKKRKTIDELLQEKGEIEKQLEDESLLDVDKADLTSKLISIEIEITMLRSVEKLNSWWFNGQNKK